MIIPPTFGSSPFSPANILSIVKLFIECSLTACLISLKISNFDDNKTLHMSSVFKIYSSEDCDFYYDGELQGHIEGNSDRAFRFEVERKGIYRLKFVNSEYKSELIQKVSIDAYEEREVELDFSEVNEPVIRERERIIIAIEHDSGLGKKLPKEIISAISKNGIATIPKGVKKIRNMAFFGSDITSITIPDSVTEIGDSAFFGCHSLASITIPDSVTEIGQSAFERCNSLTSVTIPNSVTKIGDSAFSGCHSLTSVTIPDSVTTIGKSAFAMCNNLQEFNGKFASKDGRCLIIKGVLNSFATAGLTKYDIPNIATKIGYGAFGWCSNLTSITIPDSVTEIGDYAFSGCHSLASITIPDSVTKIGQGAFSDCRSLTSVTIPDSVTWIGQFTFSWCSSLASVTIPNSVTWIEQFAFNRCSSLTSVTIPNSVTKIGDSAFNRCSSLKSIYHQATTPPILWSRFGFISSKSDLKIYVPKSEGSTVLEAYKSAKSWKSYANIIEEYDFDNE